MKTNLNDYLTNSRKLHKKQNQNKTSDTKPACIKQIITIIRRQQFDYSNKDHMKSLKIAINYGYVAPDLTILKEAYEEMD